MEFWDWHCTTCLKSGLAEVGNGTLARKLALTNVTHRHKLLSGSCPAAAISVIDGSGRQQWLREAVDAKRELVLA